MSKQNESHSKDFKSLNEWLCYLETIHNTEIDLLKEQGLKVQEEVELVKRASKVER